MMDAVEDSLEKCAQVIVKIDSMERLPRPENHEVSLRYVLKHATHEGSNIFQLFDTAKKPNHLVASRRRWLESQGRDDAKQESGRNEWYDLGYQGAKAKAPPCPNSSASAKLVVGQRRRWRPAGSTNINHKSTSRLHFKRTMTR